MSTTLSTSMSSATAATCSSSDFTKFPSTDIYCSIGSVSGLPSNASSVASKCCKSAPVNAISNSCGYYCLTYEQSVGDLSKCFQDNGIRGNDIFCSGNQTAVATGKPSSTVATSTTGPTASQSTGASSPNKTGAAGSLSASQSMSKVGLGMLGLFALSSLTGTVL